MKRKRYTVDKGHRSRENAMSRIWERNSALIFPGCLQKKPAFFSSYFVFLPAEMTVSLVSST
jgi:hypothetical protein